MKKSLLLSTLVLLSFFSFAVRAKETVYISDVLYVPMRSGHSIEYRIINAAMKSGTALELIGKSDDGEWSQVRSENGTEGWIRNQYLTDEMTSELKLNVTLTKLARLEKTHTELKASHAALENENATLKRETRQVSSTKTQLAEDLDKLKKLSAGAVELDRNYQELLQKHEVTQTQRDSLMAENEQLRNDQSLSFMLYGVGILLLGVILAIVLPVLKPKKGYSEWR